MKRTAIIMLLIVCVVSLEFGCKKSRDKTRGKDGKKTAAACPAGMVSVPGGEFTMGCSDPANGTCFDDEKPAKAVKVKKFCMDKTEVTQKQYEKVMGSNPAYFKQCGAECPVEQVTWTVARDYCKKAGKRLPTEAEWERAARAGTDTRFSWGKAPVAEYAWFAESAAGASQPVAQKKLNAYGLADMAGNVGEWAADCYDPLWYNRMPVDNPVNQTPDCPLHTVRGGSWMARTENSGNSDRSGFSTGMTTNFIGFRCAADFK